MDDVRFCSASNRFFGGRLFYAITGTTTEKAWFDFYPNLKKSCSGRHYLRALMTLFKLLKHLSETVLAKQKLKRFAK